MYEILTSHELWNLEYRVNRCLENGYQLVGGISITYDESGHYRYAQAVHKEETNAFELQVKEEVKCCAN